MRKGDVIRQDFMVLNSLANLNGALPEIKKYRNVNLFLDRDKAGLEATETLKNSLKQCTDHGDFIGPYKDLNEAWINSKNQSLKR